MGLSQAAAVAVWRPFLIHLVGLVLYSVFVFEFYRFIARKDIFTVRLEQYAGVLSVLENAVRVVLYVGEYVVLFPLFTVAWFLVFTVLLALLGTGQGIDTLLLTSMTVVTAIRATAYYHESLSQDIAKMLPFALLGGFLVDGGQAASVADIAAVITGLPGMWVTVVYYLVFLIVMEFLLRILDVVRGGTFGAAPERGTDEAGTPDAH